MGGFFERPWTPSATSRPTIAKTPPVTISSASQVEKTVASAATIVARASTSPKTPSTAATTSIAMPGPNARSFFLTSAVARSRSRPTIEFTLSVTSFVTAFISWASS